MAEAFAKPDSLPFISHYVQRRRKKRKSSLPTVVQRYFTDLTAAGGQYYELSDAITLSGDYEIEAQVYYTGDLFFVYGRNSDFNSRLRINSSGTLSWRPSSGSTEYSTAAGVVPLNQLSTIAVKLTGTTGEMFVNSSQEFSDTVVIGTANVTSIGRSFNIYSDGIISDLKIWTGGDRNTGTLIADFPLDEDWTNGNVAVNRANSANNATAENITDADATERRRDNSFSPNRWVNVNDPNDYIEIAGT